VIKTSLFLMESEEGTVPPHKGRPPGVISGGLKRFNGDKGAISRESVHQWIYKEAEDPVERQAREMPGL